MNCVAAVLSVAWVWLFLATPSHGPTPIHFAATWLVGFAAVTALTVAFDSWTGRDTRVYPRCHGRIRRDVKK